MGHEILYRRSFHCDGDLRAMDRLLFRRHDDAEASCLARKSTSYDGFEAPRNSLDVPSLLRRPTETTKIDDNIPIGYELSRSAVDDGFMAMSGATKKTKKNAAPVATAMAMEKQQQRPPTKTEDEGFMAAVEAEAEALKKRRKKKNAAAMAKQQRLPTKTEDEGFMAMEQKRKKNAAAMEEKEKMGTRRSSVIARLMGLDPLPPSPSPSSSASSFRSQNNSVFKDSFRSSQKLDDHGHGVLDFGCGYGGAPLTRKLDDHGFFGCGYGYGNDAPLTHPHDLSFRTHPQEKQLQDFKREFVARQALLLQQKQQKKNGSSKQLDYSQALAIARPPEEKEEQELLDALHFLHQNKDAFSKLLNHVPLSSSSSRHMEEAAARSLSEQVVIGSRSSREWGEIHHRMLLNLQQRGEGSGRWNRDGGGLLYQRKKATRAMEPAEDTDSVADAMIPTRIVVLTPNYSSSERSRRSSSTCSSSNRALLLLSDVDGDKEMAMAELEEWLDERRRQEKRLDRRMKDAQELARHIVKQAKEDMMRACSTSTAPRRRNLHSHSHADHHGYSSLPSSPRIVIPPSTAEPLFFPTRTKPLVASSGSFHETSTTSNRASPPGKNASSSSFSVMDRSSSSRNNAFAADDAAPQGLCNSSRKQVESVVLRDSVAAITKLSNQQKKAATTTTTTTTTKKISSRSHSPPLLRNARATTAHTAEQRSEIAAAAARSHHVYRNSSDRRREASSSTASSTLKGNDKKFVAAIATGSCEVVQQTDGARSSSIAMKDAEIIEHSIESSSSSTEEIFSDNNQTPSGFDQSTSATTDPGDTASESSIDKCEQPSPVSVLHTPFQEEDKSSSTMTKRPPPLQLITRAAPPSPADTTREDGRVQLLDPAHHPTTAMYDSSFIDLSMECVTAQGQTDEFAYVRDVLSFCGRMSMTTAAGDGIIPAAQHDVVVVSLLQNGLDPSLFHKLEKHLTTAATTAAALDEWQRRLLFDAVDEALTQVRVSYKHHCLPRSWWLSSPAPTDQSPNQEWCCRQLLQRIWSNIRSYGGSRIPAKGLQSQNEDLQDGYVSKDVMQSGWGFSEDHVGTVVTELERLICSDLIREAVHLLLKPSHQNHHLINCLNPTHPTETTTISTT